jgi:hypothetical protein
VVGSGKDRHDLAIVGASLRRLAPAVGGRQSRRRQTGVWSMVRMDRVSKHRRRPARRGSPRDDGSARLGLRIIASPDAPGLAEVHAANMLRAIASAETPLMEQVARLRRLLSGTPMLTVLGTLADRAFLNPEGGNKEYLAPTAASVEYPSWLYLVDGWGLLEGELAAGQAVEIASAAESCIHAALWDVLVSSAGTERPTALDSIRFTTRSEQMIVRGTSYLEHLEIQLRGTFSAVGPDLVRLLGFDIDDVLGLAASIRAIVGRRAAQLGSDARAAAWLAAARGRPILGIGRHESPPAVAEHVWQRGLPRSFAISAPELAVESGASPDTCSSYLRCFSLAPGSMTAAGILPGDMGPLLEAPLIALPDGTFFAHLVNHLWWAAKPRLERALREDAAARDRYTRARSRYLERRSIELIASTSRHGRAWQSLRFRFDAGEGERDYELDGLVLVDDVAFLIEAKAGSMSPAARRGAPSVVEDLRALVADAHLQASRAASYIRSRDEAVFAVRDERVVVRASAISRLFLVSATLESLSVFVTRVATIEEAGVLPVGSRPWSVCESDLAVICDLVGGVGELVHYLGRRLAIEDLNIEASDELDWFGRYLSQGLTFDRQVEEEGLLLTQTTKLDDYYMAPPEQRTRTARPCLEVDSDTRGRVAALEAAGTPGFIGAVCELLDKALPARQVRQVKRGDRRRGP